MQQLVFMHIPKTSGIAVSQAVIDAIRPPRVFFGFDLAFFGNFRDFDSVAPDNRAFIHLSPATLPPDETLVRAHMSRSTLRAAYPRAKFMTVLREPVCRLLSHFLFWRSFGDGEEQAWGGWSHRARLANGRLDDFLATPDIACQTDNVATRLLLWPHKLIPDDGFIAPAADAQLLAEATAALDGFDFADCIEHPDFAARLRAFLPGDFGLGRHNETPAMPPDRRAPFDQLMTARALGLLQARSRLDAVLWQRFAGLPPRHDLIRAAWDKAGRLMAG